MDDENQDTYPWFEKHEGGGELVIPGSDTLSLGIGEIADELDRASHELAIAAKSLDVSFRQMGEAAKQAAAELERAVKTIKEAQQS